MKNTRTIPLDRGGESWAGWRFGCYGKAKEWRLTSPAGETFTAGDLNQLRGLIVDVDFLRGHVHKLEGMIEAHACHFAADDVAVLHAALAVLSRELPAQRPRAWRGVTPGGDALAARRTPRPAPAHRRARTTTRAA